MSFLPDLFAALIFAVASVALLELPRRKFTAKAGAPFSPRYDAWLGAGLLAIGFAVFKSGLGVDFGQALVLGLACEVLAATLYADLRFLAIPDLYSGGLVVLALFHAWFTSSWLDALLGALAVGVLAAAIVFGARFVKGVEGLELGDVKLAVAMGAMLGPNWGLRAAGVAVVCVGVVLGGIIFVRRSQEAAALEAAESAGEPAPAVAAEPLEAPLGAALALAGAAALLWASR